MEDTSMLDNKCVTEILTYIHSILSPEELARFTIETAEDILERVIDECEERCNRVFNIIDRHTRDFMYKHIQPQFIESIRQTKIFDNTLPEVKRIHQAFELIAPEIELLLAEMVFLRTNEELIKQLMPSKSC